MKHYKLIIFLLLGFSNLFSQTNEKIYQEMLGLRENGIEQIKDYLIFRADSQRLCMLQDIVCVKNYNDIVIIDGVPLNLDYMDTASISRYKKTIKEIQFKQICICKQFEEIKPGWTNLILISTSHNSDGVYNVKGDKTTILIPAFSSCSFENRKTNGTLIKQINEFLPFHADITIRDINGYKIGDEEMFVTLICTDKKYMIGYYKK
jgi:hypothetical protein